MEGAVLCVCQWGQHGHNKNEWTRQLHACLLVRCVCLCAWTGGVWASWDPFSQTCADLSNQTGKKGTRREGWGQKGTEGRICVCWFAWVCEALRGRIYSCACVSVCVSTCVRVCILMLWTSEPAWSMQSCWVWCLIWSNLSLSLPLFLLLSLCWTKVIVFSLQRSVYKKVVLLGRASFGPLQINLSVEGVRTRRKDGGAQRDGSVKRPRYATLPFESNVTVTTPFQPFVTNYYKVSTKPISPGRQYSVMIVRSEFQFYFQQHFCHESFHSFWRHRKK